MADAPANHSRPWTDADIQEILILHKKGNSWKQVAEKVGRTYNAILHALRDRGLRTWMPWTPDDEQLALDLHGEGLSHREIADRLGRTKGSVDTKLNWLANDYSGLHARRKAQDIVPGWGLCLVWPMRSKRAEQSKDEKEDDE